MRSRVRYVLWVVVLGALLAVIPLVSSSAGSTSATISGLSSDMWSPMEVTIPSGGTVEFQDTTAVPHGVVWSHVPETPHCEGVPINAGKANWKGTCVFLQEGTYEFYCYVHGLGMSGKVIVTAGGTTTTTSATKSTSTTESSTTSHTTTSSATSATSATSTMTMGGPYGPQPGGSSPKPEGGQGGATAGAKAFLAPFSTVRRVASTVPANGDLNPYGIAVVPAGAGRLRAGDLLVSNFNDRANQQGTGTTIVEVSPSGGRSLFATIKAHALPGRCPGGVGLTTALSVLPGGYVVVGSLPTGNGRSATAKAGCLIVLDSRGRPVETIAGHQIQGPWDLVAVSKGSTSTLFVSNVLGGGAAKAASTVGNGTVLRIRLASRAGRPPRVMSERVIADGIPWRASPEALVVGPTGLGLASNGTLYLADTVANRITAIANAMKRTKPAIHGGRTVTAGGDLKEPLGLLVVPGGDILTTNAGDGEMVETTPSGKQLLARVADTKTGAGSLFGLTIAPGGKGVYFVDDGENTVSLLRR